MEKEIKELKKVMSGLIADACSRLEQMSQKADTSFEQTILQNAMDTLPDENADGRKDDLKILTVYYTVVGIGIDLYDVKTMEDKIRELKEVILGLIADAYFRLGQMSQKAETSFEEEILQNAMAELFDESANGRENFLKLLNVYYTVIGIGIDFCGAITCRPKKFIEEVTEV